MGDSRVRYKLKKDRFVRPRGGNSHFLDLFCSRCSHHLVLYQKDGIGALIRLYLDRIFAPQQFSDLQYKAAAKNDLQSLSCPKCAAVVGVPMVYEPENRLAFRLVPGSIAKKKSDGSYPPPS